MFWPTPLVPYTFPQLEHVRQHKFEQNIVLKTTIFICYELISISFYNPFFQLSSYYICVSRYACCVMCVLCMCVLCMCVSICVCCVHSKHQMNKPSSPFAESSWIQVDIGTSKKVTGVVIQGCPTTEHWVTKFRLQTSTDGSQWTDYTQDGGVTAVH